MGVITLGLAAGVAFPVWPTAHADPLAIVNGQALDVSAGRLDLDVEHGTATLQGDVTLRVGELEVRCPQVELRYDRSPRVSWARATGGVTATLGGIDATAASAELDTGSGTVSLHGTVKIRRGRGWLTAEHASVDIGTGKVSLQEVKGSIPVEPPRK